MSDKQITPEQALILRIVEQWGNVVNMPKMEQWLKDYAASQQPAVKAIDATPFESNTERHSLTGLTTGEYELAFIPCAEDDPRSVGGFTSDDGQSLCHVRELHLPVKAGAVWVKASVKRPEGWQLVRFGESSNRFPVRFSTNVIVDVAGKTYEAWQLEYLAESPTAAGDGKEDLALVAAMTEEGAEMWKMEYDSARRILQELVDLKDLKESEGKTADYMVRQPVAWLRAKRFLEKYQHINW